VEIQAADIPAVDILMDTCIYTNRGKEVPLGVECAIPYLVHSTPSPTRGDAERTYLTANFVKRFVMGGRRAARPEEPDPVHP
jgi:hypothetical protein